MAQTPLAGGLPVNLNALKNDLGLEQLENKIGYISQTTPVVLDNTRLSDYPSQKLPNYEDITASALQILLFKFPEALQEVCNDLGKTKVQYKIEKIVVRGSQNAVEFSVDSTGKTLFIDINFTNAPALVKNIKFNEWPSALEKALSHIPEAPKPAPPADDKLIPLTGNIVPELRQLSGNENFNAFFDWSLAFHPNFKTQSPLPDLQKDLAIDKPWLDGLLHCAKTYPEVREGLKKINKLIVHIDMTSSVPRRSDPFFWEMYVFETNQPGVITFDLSWRTLRFTRQHEKILPFEMYFVPKVATKKWNDRVEEEARKMADPNTPQSWKENRSNLNLP